MWTAALGCHRADPWRAPWWSWPSLDGQIYPYDSLAGPTRTLIRVIDAKVTPAEGVTDEFGPVSRDLIHLSANSIKIHYDNILILYAYRFRLDIETLQAGRTLVYMIVEFDDDEKRTRGLLLEQTTGSRGEYPRIGTLNVYDPKVEDSRAETSDRSFLEACDNNQTLLELTEDDYESIDEPSEDGVEMDRITLVLYPLMNGSKLSNHHATIASDSDALYSSHSKAVYQQQSQSFS